MFWGISGMLGGKNAFCVTEHRGRAGVLRIRTCVAGDEMTLLRMTRVVRRLNSYDECGHHEIWARTTQHNCIFISTTCREAL